MEIKKHIYKLSGGFTILPVYLAVNIINKCNRRCNFCPYHSPYLSETEHDVWFMKQPGKLDFYNFENFINRISKFKWITHVALTGKGEPLLHPQFLDFCYLLESKKIKFSVTTNGDKLNHNVLYALNEFDYLTGVRISIYDSKDISKFKLLRSMYDFISLFNQTGEYISGVEEGYTVQYKGTEEYANMPADFNKSTYCKTPFSFLTINTDGSIVPCYSYHEVGNINDSLWKIYNGKEIRKYRRDTLKMQATMSDCKNCGINIKNK